MKEIFILLMFLCPALAFSQSVKTMDILAHYKDHVYKVDSNKVTVAIVFESVKGRKEDLYKKAKCYLTRAYSDHNSELKEDNEVAGILEVESVDFSFFSYTAESTIPVNYHVFYTLRIDVRDDQFLVFCSATDLIAEWSTIGNGFKVERHPVVNCVPLGKEKVFEDADKTADAFLALVDKMNVIISAVNDSMIENK